MKVQQTDEEKEKTSLSRCIIDIIDPSLQVVVVVGDRDKLNYLAYYRKQSLTKFSARVGNKTKLQEQEGKIDLMAVSPILCTHSATHSVIPPPKQ